MLCNAEIFHGISELGLVGSFNFLIILMEIKTNENLPICMCLGCLGLYLLHILGILKPTTLLQIPNFPNIIFLLKLKF